MKNMNTRNKVLLVGLISLTLTSSHGFGMGYLSKIKEAANFAGSYIADKYSDVASSDAVKKAVEVVKVNPRKTGLIAAGVVVGTGLVGYGAKKLYNRFKKPAEKKAIVVRGNAFTPQTKGVIKLSKPAKKTLREKAAAFGSKAKNLASKAGSTIATPFKAGYRVVRRNPKKTIAAVVATGLAGSAAVALRLNPELINVARENGLRGFNSACEYGAQGLSFARNNGARGLAFARKHGARGLNYCKNLFFNTVVPTVVAHKVASSAIAASVPGVPAAGYATVKGVKAAKAGLKARAQRLAKEELGAIAKVKELAETFVKNVEDAKNDQAIRSSFAVNPIAEMLPILEKYNNKEWAQQVTSALNIKRNFKVGGNSTPTLNEIYNGYMQNVVTDNNPEGVKAAKKLLVENMNDIVDFLQVYRK